MRIFNGVDVDGAFVGEVIEDVVRVNSLLIRLLVAPDQINPMMEILPAKERWR